MIFHSFTAHLNDHPDREDTQQITARRFSNTYYMMIVMYADITKYVCKLYLTQEEYDRLTQSYGSNIMQSRIEDIFVIKFRSLNLA